MPLQTTTICCIAGSALCVCAVTVHRDDAENDHMKAVISDSTIWLCSAQASLPLNVDLEMTFPMKDGVQSYQPKFELLSEGQASQTPANQQAAAGSCETYNSCSILV